MRTFLIGVAALIALVIYLAVTDDCRKPGTASFKLNQMLDLRGCK